MNSKTGWISGAETAVGEGLSNGYGCGETVGGL